MSLLRLLPAAVTVAALLLPASAPAAQLLGSPLDGSRGTVDAVGCGSPCTIVQESIDGLPLHADGGVITSWKAVVSSGSTARLRVLTRQAAGSYTALASGKAVTGDDTLQTVSDHVVIPAGATIGLDVDGTAGGIATGGRVAGFVPALADGQAGSTDLGDDELLLQARVEADVDGDGLGDETEDACVFCAPAPGPGPAPGPAPDPVDAGGDDDGPAPERYSIGPEALLVPGAKPFVRAYTSNGLDDVEGTLKLKVGGKVAARARVWSISGAQNTVDFRVSAKAAAALHRKGASAVVSGDPAVEGGGSAHVAQRVRVVHGTTTAYDGTYRGAGPLVVVVRNGVVMSATRSLLVTSTRGTGSRTQTFALPDDGPAVIGRTGRVDARGSWTGQSVAFKARFTPGGTAKGYLSLWHTELGFSSGGSLTTDEFFGASNWSAKR